MTLTRLALACTALLASAAAAPAFESDDAAWIRRCVSDNASAGQGPETLAVYCGCMNDKMPNDETLSITAWEKTHRTEQETCSTLAKWRSPEASAPPPAQPVPPAPPAASPAAPQDQPSGRRTSPGAQP
jgi:hypothetical protein